MTYRIFGTGRCFDSQFCPTNVKLLLEPLDSGCQLSCYYLFVDEKSEESHGKVRESRISWRVVTLIDSFMHLKRDMLAAWWLLTHQAINIA